MKHAPLLGLALLALAPSCGSGSSSAEGAAGTGLQALAAPVAKLSTNRLTRPGSVTVRAQVGPDVTKVEFFRNGQSVGVDAQAPFELQETLTKPESAVRRYTVKATGPRSSATSTSANLQVLIGRVLYVSPNGNPANDGLSEARPKPTIQDALDLTQPGDTVLVMNGTYSRKEHPEWDAVQISRSGTRDAWIALMAYPGHEPLIESVNWVGIRVQASYIIVDGMTLEGNLNSLDLAGAKAAMNDPQPKYGGNGIEVAPPWDDKTLRPHHVTIRNNEVRRFPGGGISSLRTDYLTIEANLVYSVAYYSPFGPSAISVYQSCDMDANTGYKVVVRGNIVSDAQNRIPFIYNDPDPAKRVITDGNGIIIDDNRQTQNFNNENPCAGRPYGGRTLVENNISHNNGARGIHAFSSDHVDIVNNTTYRNSYQAETPEGEITAYDAADIRILNNIAVALPGRKGVSIGSTVANAQVSKNLIYGGVTPDADPARNLIGQDPRLVNPAAYDFRPAADGPAVDAGDRSLAPKTDIFGTARPLGAGVDLGALEVR